jgi:hypothetical protein
MSPEFSYWGIFHLKWGTPVCGIMIPYFKFRVDRNLTSIAGHLPDLLRARHAAGLDLRSSVLRRLLEPVLGPGGSSHSFICPSFLRFELNPNINLLNRSSPKAVSMCVPGRALHGGRGRGLCPGPTCSGWIQDTGTPIAGLHGADPAADQATVQRHHKSGQPQQNAAQNSGHSFLIILLTKITTV